MLNVSRQLRHVRSRHRFQTLWRQPLIQTARLPNRSNPIMTSRDTSPGCESVRTRYDLSRTTGQGALIWSAIRVRHRPRPMHHKLAWLLYFSSAPLFPFVPVTRWSLLFADQLLFVFVLTGPRAKLKKILSHLSFRVYRLSPFPIDFSNLNEFSWIIAKEGEDELDS